MKSISIKGAERRFGYAQGKVVTGSTNVESSFRGAILDASLRYGLSLNQSVDAFINARYIGGRANGQQANPSIAATATPTTGSARCRCQWASTSSRGQNRTAGSRLPARFSFPPVPDSFGPSCQLGPCPLAGRVRNRLLRRRATQAASCQS